jgi:predicted nucleic acid-binding protein
MKYVLDASVALKWVLPEAGSERAISLGHDFKNGIHELVAPDSLPLEVAHALTRAERRGIIQPPDGMQRFRSISSMLPQLHSCLKLLPRAFEISSQMKIGLYDCLYVALAEREQCTLVTADMRLERALGTHFPQIVLLTSLP